MRAHVFQCSASASCRFNIRHSHWKPLYVTNNVLYLFAGLCRRLKFSSKIDGYALQFHVIKTFELSIYVGPSVSSACTHRCIMDPVCVSVNIGPPTDETFICELSDSDHTKQPADLRKREGFLYIGTEVLIVFLNKRYIFVPSTCFNFDLRCFKRNLHITLNALLKKEKYSKLNGVLPCSH